MRLIGLSIVIIEWGPSHTNDRSLLVLEGLQQQLGDLFLHCNRPSPPALLSSLLCVILSTYVTQPSWHQYFDDAQSANTVSADYDRIAGLFEDIASCLEGFKILEGRIPPIPELKLALARVLTNVLVLCGICAKQGKMSRFSKHVLCTLVLWKRRRMLPLDCVTHLPERDTVP